jgi:hypothetical protein
MEIKLNSSESILTVTTDAPLDDYDAVMAVVRQSEIFKAAMSELAKQRMSEYFMIGQAPGL